MPINNTAMLGGKQVYHPPHADFVNWFASGTGAGKYGHGLFLLTAEDYTAVSTAAENGLSSLVLSDHRGTQITMPVYVCSAMPYLPKKGNAFGIMAVRVADRRYDQDRSVTKAFNVQQRGFAYDGSTPKFTAGTLVGSAEYTWSQLATGAEFPEIPSPPTWKPRNVIFDGWHLHRALDWVAAELFLVVGWDNASAFSFHVPGVMTDANTALFDAAFAGLYDLGGQGKRNTLRLPKHFSVIFRGAAPTFSSTDRSYVKLTNVGGQGTTQALSAGGYIATRSGSTWLEQSALDAVATDLAARAYAFLSVQPALYEFSGIVPFKPDGAIRDILWVSNKKGARTKILQGCRFDWAASSNGGLGGFADPGIPGAMPRHELPSDQLIVGLGGVSSSVGPSGTHFLWGGGPVRVYITGDGGYGGGKYAGKILPEPTTAVATTGNLAQADLGGTVGTECLVLNMQEVGGSTHWLTDAANTNQKSFLGMMDGATSGGIPIVYIGGLWAKVCT